MPIALTLVKFISIAAANDASCGLDENKRVLCWGWIGSQRESSLPIVLAGNSPVLFASVMVYSATYIFATDETGQAWAYSDQTSQLAPMLQLVVPEVLFQSGLVTFGS